MSRYAAAPRPRSGCAASALRVCSAPASSSEYTATLRSPRAAAARMTRIAISPRLATRRLCRGIGPQQNHIRRRPLNPPAGTADFPVVQDLTTPFRQRLERSLSLELPAQIEECADYLS